MAYLYRTHAVSLLSQRTLFAYSKFLLLLSEIGHGTVRFFALATIFVRGNRMKVFNNSRGPFLACHKNDSLLV